MTGAQHSVWTDHSPWTNTGQFSRPADAVVARVEGEMETFVPAEVAPARSGIERRALGARVSFGVVPS